MNLRRFFCTAIVLFVGSITAGTPPLNLFNPYDTLMLPAHWPNSRVQFLVGYEGSYKARAFQDDYDDRCNDFRKKRDDVLQLYQDKQDALAAFKGFPTSSKYGQFAQQFNITDDNGGYGLYIPRGKLHVNANLMFTGAYHFTNQLSLFAFLPYYDIALKNVCWQKSPNIPFYENFVAGNLITHIEEIACMDLQGWHRRGLGDLTVLARWFGDFIQSRPLLRNVRLEARGGLIFPTGKKEDINQLFAFPFGNNAGLGLLFAGHLELWVGRYVTFAVDTEFMHLFGSTRARRIKTDPAQTDLLLLACVPAFCAPGFTQHYTLYAEASRFVGGLSARLAYQYTMQNESKLYLCSNLYNPRLANSAEHLQEWTNHSMILQFTYDGFNGQKNARFKPYASAFAKWGFNGRRTIACDTLGVQFGLSY